MNKLTSLMAIVALACAMQAAKADLVELGQYEKPANSGNSPSDEAEFIKGWLTLSTAPSYLAKLSPTETWEGPQASNFDSDGINGSDDTATYVSWNLEDTGFFMAYALVKAGNNYNLYGILAGSNQEIIGDWTVESPLVPVGNPNDPQMRRQGISHVTFFGVPGTSVPDGGLTAMLLGLGLAGVGMGRRLIKK